MKRFRFWLRLLGICVLVPGAFAWWRHHSAPPVAVAAPGPIEFARSNSIRLSHGDPAVESAIDFDNLSGGGMPIGATYSMIPDEARKAAFRREFIANYARTFQRTGASIESLTNWRVDSVDAAQVTVAADLPDGHTALVILTNHGADQKIIGFNMR